jgi:hypothetical protein
MLYLYKWCYGQTVRNWERCGKKRQLRFYSEVPPLRNVENHLRIAPMNTNQRGYSLDCDLLLPSSLLIYLWITWRYSQCLRYAPRPAVPIRRAISKYRTRNVLEKLPWPHRGTIPKSVWGPTLSHDSRRYRPILEPITPESNTFKNNLQHLRSTFFLQCEKHSFTPTNTTDKIIIFCVWTSRQKTRRQHMLSRKYSPNSICS